MVSFLPSPAQVSRETIAVFLATVLAAYAISRFPELQKYVGANSLTVNVKPQLPG